MGRAAPLGFGIPVLLALVLTACVSDASGPSPTDPHALTTTTTVATTVTTLKAEEGLAAFRSCLGEQGVTIDEIRRDGLGRPRMAEALAGLDFADRAVLDALEACGGYLASGALDLGPDPQLAKLVMERLEDFSRCMRLEGVADYPDPDPDFDGIGSPFPVRRIPWSDPDFETAVEMCGDGLGV